MTVSAEGEKAGMVWAEALAESGRRVAIALAEVEKLKAELAEAKVKHQAHIRAMGVEMANERKAADAKLSEVEAEREAYRIKSAGLQAELAALKSTAKEVEAVVDAARCLLSDMRIGDQTNKRWPLIQRLRDALAALYSKPEGKPEPCPYNHATGPRNERGLCPECNYPLTNPAPPAPPKKETP